MNRILLIFFIILFSCDNYFVPKNSKAIARLNQDYLFEDQISVIIDGEQEKLDSILKVNEFINQWAINKILRSGARLNLSENKLSKISSMVYNYETELLSNNYLEALVNSQISLKIDSIKLDSLYNKNKEIFKQNLKTKH